MNHNIYIYIFVMAAVTYLIRMLPLTLIRKEIKSTYIKSFFILCPLCDACCYDIPGNPQCHCEYLVCTCRIYHRRISGLPWQEPAEGILVRMSRRLYC